MASKKKKRLEPQVQAEEVALSTDPVVDDPESHIAVTAYLMAERRGFEPGFELDDWLAAKAELQRNGDHRRTEQTNNG
jgi:hypothetical protein